MTVLLHFLVCKPQTFILVLVTCPANADCFPNGPGSTECLCQRGWFGYKCLVKVRFFCVCCGLIPTDIPDFEGRG